MAVLAGEKAQQTKLWCQGADFPDFGRCAAVVERVKGKLREEVGRQVGK